MSKKTAVLPIDQTYAEPLAVNGPAYGIVLLFLMTVFTSAFLLFQVQPVIAKFILPWFGSSPGVWATCMLFFQLLLLVGYGYTHFAVSRLPPKNQVILHCILLILALLYLPIAPDSLLKPVGADTPVTHILRVLLLSVGLPYMLLSASGPLLQGWFARVLPNRSPYRLYALSNAGSLLGLLSYPFVFEPHFALRSQSMLWSVGFGLFALFCILCAGLFLRHTMLSSAAYISDQKVPLIERNNAPSANRACIASWLIFSACPAALMLATTNQLSIDVAVVPFLWVLPLSIYLLTFILCFDSDRWYFRPFYFVALPLVLMNVVRVLYRGIELGLTEQVISYCSALFVCCMCLHGELSRRKPDPAQMTLFYLFVSLGGVAGGSFVALFSPAFFSGYYEYPILISSCAALMVFIMLRLNAQSKQQTLKARSNKRYLMLGFAAVLASLWLTFDKTTWQGSGRSSSTETLFELWYQQLLIATLVSISIMMVLAEWGRRKKKQTVVQYWISPHNLVCNLARGALLLSLMVLVASLVWVTQEEQRRQIFRERNFYGVLAIREYNAGSSQHLLGLRDGRISHGEQLQQHQDWPTSYYGPKSGVGVALRLHPNRALADREFRVGIIGLGTGTLAAYANNIVKPESSNRHYVKPRHGAVPDYFRFYELNPLVADWAKNKFTFLDDARTRGADVKVLMGDARLVLERQLTHGQAQNFDVLILDAFSSDAIAMHLLTKEALQTYWQHLAKDGVLALHVSNRFLNIKPVVRRLAIEMKKDILYTKNKNRYRRSITGASWMIMTNNKTFMSLKEVRRFKRTLPDIGPLWTDDFSSLFEVLKK